MKLTTIIGPLALVPLAMLAGCSDTVYSQPEPCITSFVYGRLTQPGLEKLDIVLAIDNSPSMADKQAILALAVPDLVNRLVNPRCLDESGIPTQFQPTYPIEECPVGANREFEPILDIHIGVISSSIGGHGADACPNVDQDSKECSPAANLTNNDRGHLLARFGPCGGAEVPTYMNKKFLAWDPAQKNGGEIVIDDGMGKGLVPTLRDMVSGVGQIGCRYESLLESIYRFLADPNPYETITVENSKATPIGTDHVLLAQRASFLRPDSLLAIVMLTDENDCSIKEYGQFYYVGQQRNGATPVRLPRARKICETAPANECCKSCGQAQGACGEDPTCKDPNGGTGPALLAPEDDDTNLRCWDQKRRFGIDFLYPTDRYVQAFSSASIPDRFGNLVPNPLFSDLNVNDSNSNIRDSGMVFVAGIVGVPWQDIARDKLDPKKGFKTANELNEPIGGSGVTAWDVILGDPANHVKPLDPLMIEAYEKRSGTNPITGDVLVDANTPNANPINGHEWTIANDDLQYACTFPVLSGTERDCTDPNQTACDCSSPTNDNPLCAPNPNDNGAPTLQVRAKAHPSIRPLSVLRDMGSQGVVASVCPVQLDDQSAGATDFGYRSAVATILERLMPALGGQCLPRTLDVNEDGTVACMLIEAANSGGNCVCDAGKARRSIEPDSGAARLVSDFKQDPLAANAGWDCFCELVQLESDARQACQVDAGSTPAVNGEPVNGWCYIDATTSPPTGNAELVAKCPDNTKRDLRFVGAGEVQPGATVFVTCRGDILGCGP